MTEIEQARANLVEALKCLYAADASLLEGDLRVAVIKIDYASAHCAEAQKTLPAAYRLGPRSVPAK